MNEWIMAVPVQAHQAAGDLEAAERCYTKAVQLGDAASNRNFDAIFAAGCLQQALNRTADAEASFRRALEVGAAPLGRGA